MILNSTDILHGNIIYVLARASASPYGDLKTGIELPDSGKIIST